MTTAVDISLDREITIAPVSKYVHPLTRDTITRAGYTARCATQQTDTPKINYEQALALVPEGYRMSALEEIAYLVQCEARLKTEGRNPREALQDALFARQIQSDPYRWNHTHFALRAPKGKEIFPIESDGQGRKSARADYLLGSKIIYEGGKVPISQGGKVMLVDAFGIPVDVTNGNEPEHTLHWYFDPEHYEEKKEVAVQLVGVWYGDEHGRCLRLDAFVGRSYLDSGASFRVFQGSLDEIPLPEIEYYIKNQESYDRGIADGIRQERERFARELDEFSAKLKE